ncbi:hypothetical protein Taro_016951 [Colocasia esculenta]|uniref:Uncharacterized protein n=1 Tax=Colocasia esculenta TaxID=4460 RepID=A0A843ULU4_COLES|nr:hypothetical protein [Colocasia esculenta]
MLEDVAPGGRRAQVTDLEQKGKMMGTALVWVSEVVQVLVRCGLASPAHYSALVPERHREVKREAAVRPECGVCGCVLGYDSLASLYRGGCRKESATGVQEGWTVCPSLSCLWRWLGCSCCDGVSHAVSEIGFLVALVYMLYGFSWGAWCRHPTAVLVTRSLVPSVVAPECLLPHMFDSAGSAGVVFGLTRVVVEALLYFRCFVVASFPAGSECVAAIAGCVCFERGC